MVRPGLPNFTWEEYYGPGDDKRLAERIVASLQSRLAEKCDLGRVVYVAAPNPGFHEDAEAGLVRVAGPGADFHVVKRRRRPNAYVTGDARLFRFMLPTIFRLGRPEVTLIAFGDNKPAASGLRLDDTIGTLIEARGGDPTACFVGMHFDSGDLFDLF